MRKNLQTIGAVTAPVIPVIVMAIIVTLGMPPICSETTDPIGIVMDFGKSESIKVSLNPKILLVAMTQKMLVRLPTQMPVRMEIQYFLRF